VWCLPDVDGDAGGFRPRGEIGDAVRGCHVGADQGAVPGRVQDDERLVAAGGLVERCAERGVARGGGLVSD
jgi:hypothetical protein